MAEIHDNEISTPSGSTTPDPLGSSYPAGSYPTTTAVTTGTETSKSDEAKQKAAAAADQATTEAANVKDHAMAAATDVKEQAMGELSSIKQEAKQEVKSLAYQAKDQIGSQADNATKQIASSLTEIGQELRSMAERSEKQGPLTDVVRQLGQRVESTATRLETNGYQSVAQDLQRFARNKPGLFLLGAAGAGFLVGRLLRNTDTQSLTQAAKGEQSQDPYGDISGMSYSGDLYGANTAAGAAVVPEADAYAASVASTQTLPIDDFSTTGTGYTPGGGVR